MGFSIDSYWGSRRENPEECAIRFERMIDLLAAIDPVFGTWLFRVKSRIAPVASIRGPKLAQRIADGVACSDDGDPTPISGYMFGAGNSALRSPLSWTIRVEAGAYDPLFGNSVFMDTDRTIPPDPAIITPPIVRAVMLALVRSWDAALCVAHPAGLREHRKTVPGGWPPVAPNWMAYVAPPWAALLSPPSSLTVETPPEGGLLMIATEAPFETANPAHLAAALDIEAALAPLNALPWLTEAGSVPGA